LQAARPRGTKKTSMQRVPCGDDEGSSVTIEPPDVCLWRLVGPVSADTMRELYEVQWQFSQGKPYLLVLVDLSRVGPVSREARKVSAEGPRNGQTMPVRGTAVFGASFHVRVLMTLVTKALRVMYPETAADNPTAYFETEADARAWLDERRRRTRLDAHAEPC
jgi:hypothetical protein